MGLRQGLCDITPASIEINWSEPCWQPEKLRSGPLLVFKKKAFDCRRSGRLALSTWQLISLGLTWGATPTRLNKFFTLVRNSRFRMEYIIGLHTELTKKIQVVDRVTSAGILTFFTNWRQSPTIQPGKKHNRNAAMIMLTSTAAFRSFMRLSVSLRWISAPTVRSLRIGAAAFLLRMFAVFKTRQFRKTITRKGTTNMPITYNAMFLAMESSWTDHPCSQKNTSGLYT